jgi:hypothetical protein
VYLEAATKLAMIVLCLSASIASRIIKDTPKHNLMAMRIRPGLIASLRKLDTARHGDEKSQVLVYLRDRLTRTARAAGSGDRAETHMAIIADAKECIEEDAHGQLDAIGQMCTDDSKCDVIDRILCRCESDWPVRIHRLPRSGAVSFFRAASPEPGVLERMRIRPDLAERIRGRHGSGNDAKAAALEHIETRLGAERNRIVDGEGPSATLGRVVLVSKEMLAEDTHPWLDEALEICIEDPWFDICETISTKCREEWEPARLSEAARRRLGSDRRVARMTW